jgi:putative membrane protein
MKKIGTALLTFSALCIMQACNDSSTGTTSSTDSSAVSVDTAGSRMSDTTNRMMDSSNRLGDTSTMNKAPLDKDATEFVTKAASGGMMEVELGKVAQQKAQNQRVKDFGSMMVTDHTQANDELKSIVSSKNGSVPSAMMPEHQKHVDELNNKTGAAFDKSYMKMMLEDHKKDVAEFKKTSEKSTDADIKNFAAKTLPVLQKHLDSAKAINSKM